ncbi:hypothetical protein N015_13165 [Pseudomonas asturiensis]|uniref:Uncharacterized protein n=1 Tax=Pseudomonas asturiensis TaxID=1190415 RepID=A0ABX6HD89_9PSED|nr:hypothetical protein [Pseudomonas asturiensis]QHF03304.1 hypothetical protein N015_13165 [Pseudomonas asturiensis]
MIKTKPGPAPGFFVLPPGNPGEHPYPAQASTCTTCTTCTSFIDLLTCTTSLSI